MAGALAGASCRHWQFLLAQVPCFTNAVQRSHLGAKYCTPEIDTSEIIVDFQWHFPMDLQWYFPKDCHLSAVFSQGLSPYQWIFTGKFKWIVRGISQRIFAFVLTTPPV